MYFFSLWMLGEIWPRHVLTRWLKRVKPGSGLSSFSEASWKSAQCSHSGSDRFWQYRQFQSHDHLRPFFRDWYELWICWAVSHEETPQISKDLRGCSLPNKRISLWGIEWMRMCEWVLFKLNSACGEIRLKWSGIREIPLMVPPPFLLTLLLSLISADDFDLLMCDQLIPEVHTS